jgi:hypothetical protein
LFLESKSRRHHGADVAQSGRLPLTGCPLMPKSGAATGIAGLHIRNAISLRSWSSKAATITS